ncbi:hypothetical protein OG413_23190 [Streptomyces sp. NBC_01433]|uniref:hypothetical protein n=1 Tax=Streptomyces sp. NBC_01433 TaxID=2903864 RepID=UPI002256D1E9|nr:hypothetical protein [Streptomyces sp. NBC_01433]MCX4678187.1 hypothetical protein [Streptomyces sp. NBC_01433]
MRPTRRRTRVLLAASVIAVGLAVPVGVQVANGASAGPVPAAPEPEPAGSECRTTVEGSRVVAYCHNPYPSTDLVQLHTECVRWWDVDADGAAVAVEPGRTVRLDDRCWKEVATAWVSHRPGPA